MLQYKFTVYIFTIILLKCFARICPLFTCELSKKGNDKAILTMIYAVSHIHPRSLENLRHTVRIPNQSRLYKETVIMNLSLEKVFLLRT